MGFGGNNLHSHHQSLVIPVDFASVPPEDTLVANPTAEQVCGLARQQLLRDFCRSEKCSPEEGLITLSLAHFNLNAAIVESRAMNAFAAAESTQPELMRVVVQVPVGMTIAACKSRGSGTAAGWCRVTKVKEGGNAAATERIHVGMRIIAVNGTPSCHLGRKQTAALIKASKDVCVIDLLQELPQTTSATSTPKARPRAEMVLGEKQRLALKLGSIIA
jgi:hypothetical protein